MQLFYFHLSLQKCEASSQELYKTLSPWLAAIPAEQLPEFGVREERRELLLLIKIHAGAELGIKTSCPIEIK